MGGGIHTEVLLVTCYAVFLMAIAGALELAARYSHHRSTQIQLAGFRYDPKLDLWTCPNDQKLLRAAADYQRNVVVYRAAAHACNTCAMKTRCTDSDRGRTIEHALDSWLKSELRRFHRGMSLTLFALAGVFLMIEFFRYNDPADRALIGAIEVITIAMVVRLASPWMRGSIAGRL
jgi:hypothetical protein